MNKAGRVKSRQSLFYAANWRGISALGLASVLREEEVVHRQ